MVRRAVLLLAIDVVVAVAVAPDVWAHPGQVTLGRKTDAPYTIWALAWAARAVTHGASPFVTTGMSWPAHVNLLTNATMIGAGVVLAPLTVVAGALVTFNVLAFGGLALTAWSTQLVLLRSRLAGGVAAGVGGVVAGFAPLALAQTEGAHLHVAAAWLLPPLFLGLGRLLSGTARHPARWGAAIGALAAAQLLIGEELLAIAAITAVVVVIATVVVARGVDWRGLGIGAVASAVVFLPLAAWPLWLQFDGPGHIKGAIQAGALYPTDLTAFVVPHGVWLGTGVLGSLTRHYTSEGGAYLGVPLLVMCIVSVVAGRRRAVVRVLGVTAGVLVVLALGAHLVVGGNATGVPMPWDAVSHLPLLENLIPARFGIPLDLAAGALLAVGLSSLGGVAQRARHARRRSRSLVAGVVAVACVAPLVPRVPLHASRWEVPDAFVHPSMTGVPAGAVVALGPYPQVTRPDPSVWLAVAGAQWRSQGGVYFIPSSSGRVTIGGPAPAWAVVEVEIEAGADPATMGPQRGAVLASLRGARVAAVIVGPMARRAEVVRWWTTVLGPGASVGGVTLWRVSSATP